MSAPPTEYSRGVYRFGVFEFDADRLEPIVRPRRRLPATGIVFVVLSVTLMVIASAIVYRALTTRHMPTIVAVARFDNETGDASLNRFVDALTDTVTVQLAEAGDGQFSVVGNAAILRAPRQDRDLRAIASTLHAGFVVLGQVQRDDQRVRVLAHLIRMPDQTHVRVSRTDNVPDTTLTEADEVAGRIAREFSQAAATH